MAERTPEMKAEYARRKRERRAARRADRADLIEARLKERAREVKERQAQVRAERLAVVKEVSARGGDIAEVAAILGLRPGGVAGWATDSGVSRLKAWKTLGKEGLARSRAGKPPEGVDPADLPPTPQQRRQARLDDIEWMVSWGASDTEVARRTSMTLNALERYLCRYGRWDLWAKMTKYRAPNAWRESEEVVSA